MYIGLAKCERVLEYWYKQIVLSVQSLQLNPHALC
jgi:hypothetical protein